ncbi:MAG TPA: amidohydrolase [Acidimicrobiales bacterium]|nr:amidohydrolase [Acidimicrobiales bacterium]
MAAPASAAFVGGSICTLDPERPLAEACAVRGGRIVGVGSEEEIRQLCGASTEVIDVHGGMVIPGFQDAHVHPPMGGVEMLRCDLTAGRSRADYLAIVGSYAAAHPDVEWIRGGGWSMPAFPGGLPTATDLDAVVGARPVFLPNRDHHSAWVSSRALELAGITAHTPDPIDGRIERDASGRPTGALHEGAMGAVERLLPPLHPSDYVEGILAAQAYLHSLGITAWQDAWVTSGPGQNTFEAYLSLAGDGRLTARVVAAHWWERGRGADQVEGFSALRAAASESDRLAGTSVKIMQDGVCETFTAAMLTPYLDVHGHATDNCGLSFVDPEALKEHVRRLDAEGFQVHVHAIGDRAVREALDAIEAARRANGPNALRHHIAHLQVVHPEDLDRFASLGVVANFQPLWACADEQMVELTMPFLGPERTALQYPIGSLVSRRVPVAFGSDWPVSSPNPLAELHVAVKRQAPTGHGEGADESAPTPAFLPDERISLREALQAFTLGSAYVNHLEADTGSIEVGKFADLAVVDRNLFEVDDRDGGLADARVVMTIVEGDVVYEQASV